MNNEDLDLLLLLKLKIYYNSLVNFIYKMLYFNMFFYYLFEF